MFEGFLSVIKKYEYKTIDISISFILTVITILFLELDNEFYFIVFPFFLAVIYSSRYYKLIQKLDSKIKQKKSFSILLENFELLNKEQIEILHTLYINKREYKFPSYKEEVKSLVNNGFIAPVLTIQEFDTLYRLNKRVYEKMDNDYDKRIQNNLFELNDNEKKILDLFFTEDYNWIDCEMQSAILSLEKKDILIHSYDKSIELGHKIDKKIETFFNKKLLKNKIPLELSKMASCVVSGGGSSPNRL